MCYCRMWLNMIGTRYNHVGEITPTQFDSSYPSTCYNNWQQSNQVFPTPTGRMSFSWSTSGPDVTGSTGGKRTKIAHHTSVTPATISSWDINDSLAADFDGSLSGLGSELGSTTYNMSEALLALPVFKQENLDTGFQYILGAATSPAVKMNEETLTYLNQGQSYEIKVKKLGDLSEFQGKFLRSLVKISFHERRLQYMEKEQLESWKINRPGERILDIDIPLSYGLVDIQMDSDALNTAEFIWDPTKETGIYVRVNCISTEFTAKKHGGEKGVPFRIQMETYAHSPEEDAKLLHCASCQVKVFKPKGADRKHKTDREKMDKRSEAEKEKYQPSYECTVLTEVPLDQVVTTQSAGILRSPGSFNNLSQRLSEMMPRSPTNSMKSPGPLPSKSANGETSDSDQGGSKKTITTTPVTSSSLPTLPTVPVCTSLEPHTKLLASDASANEVTQWLQINRFSNYARVFQNFSGADLLRLSREDLIQICGIADGIRLNNALQSRSVRPRLTIYVCQETDSVYHALYIESLTSHELVLKLACLYNVMPQQIGELYCQGPSGIYVLVNDEVVSNLQDQARFCVEAMKADGSDLYKVLLKTIP